MSFSPVTASKHITEKYYRYLKTSFKMPDPYRSEFEHLIDSGESFAAGPYLDVTDAFKKRKKHFGVDFRRDITKYLLQNSHEFGATAIFTSRKSNSKNSKRT